MKRPANRARPKCTRGAQDGEKGNVAAAVSMVDLAGDGVVGGGREHDDREGDGDSKKDRPRARDKLHSGESPVLSACGDVVKYREDVVGGILGLRCAEI